MEPQNYLGIYLSKNYATVVCLSSQGKEYKIEGCFSVSVEKQEEQNQQALADLIARGCAERVPMSRELEVSVALDCSMFMQHNVHSEFGDPKQITQTIRFDTEEALAKDVADVAIAFKIDSSDQTGSALTVFTAQRKVLSDILLALQSNNIDPVTIEPDVNCISRFIGQNVSSPELGQGGTLFGIFSICRGYFIVPILSELQKTSHIPTMGMRTFLVGPKQNRTELLAREISVTAALAGTGEAINSLKIFDSAGTVNYQQLGERLGIEASGVDLAESANADSDILADCSDPVDFAIAYGAALAHLEKTKSINFRNDFMPYLGKKMRLQNALKFAAISVTVLMLALGMYVTSQLLRTNKDRSRLRDKLRPEYSAVMLGKKPPNNIKDAVKKLNGLKRHIERAQVGLFTGDQATTAKLMLVLEAFNKSAAQTNLQIDKVSIIAKNIRVIGSTSSRSNTLKLFNAVKEKMEIATSRYEMKPPRDNFTITLVPKRGT